VVVVDPHGVVRTIPECPKEPTAAQVAEQHVTQLSDWFRYGVSA